MNSLYVWKPITEREDFLQFCLKENVHSIFFSANRMAEDPEGTSDSIWGPDFLALASTNEFALRPELALDYINDVITFNQRARKPFVGVHFDVEPHGLPDYKESKRDILESYVAMIAQSYQKCQKNGLEFGVSIPFWYDIDVALDGTTKPCFQHVIDNSGHVSIMAYRATIPKIVRCVRKEMDYSRKKVFVAVGEFSVRKEIQVALNKAYTFEGLALHHYNKFKNLYKDWGKNP